MKTVPMERVTGEMIDKETKKLINYTNYFIIVNGIKIKVKLDAVGKQLVDVYLESK